MPNDMPTFDELTALLKTKPLDAAGKAQQLSKKLTTMRYEIAAIGVGLAYYLAANPERRETFYQNPFWRARLKKPNRGKLLLHCLMYVYGSHQGSEAKRAGDHAGALQTAYKEKMPVAGIPDYIKSSGGFDKLLKDTFDGLADDDGGEKALAKNATDAGVSHVSCLSRQSESEDDDDAVADDDAAEEGLTIKEAPRKKKVVAGNSLLRLDPIPRSKLLEYLIVEADEELREEIFGLSVNEKRHKLTVKRLPDSLEYSVDGNQVPFRRFELLEG